MRQLKYPSDAVGVTHYVFEYFGQKDLQGNDVKHRFALFDPVVVEFTSSCIAQQALRTGRQAVLQRVPDPAAPMATRRTTSTAPCFTSCSSSRPPSTGSPSARATPGTGSTATAYATELAVMRGQLELMTPYEHIQRPQRDLAVFIPPANPESARDPEVAKAENEQWTILKTMSEDLVKYGPDVLLTEQLDKYEDYKNIILVLGFTDGPTDTYLTELLKNPPSGQEDPRASARRLSFSASRDAERAAISPMPCSTFCRSVRWEACRLRSRSIREEGRTEHHPECPAKSRFTDGEWIEAGGQTVGWRRGNLMVLAGIPSKRLRRVGGVVLRPEAAGHAKRRNAAHSQSRCDRPRTRLLLPGEGPEPDDTEEPGGLRSAGPKTRERRIRRAGSGRGCWIRTSCRSSMPGPRTSAWKARTATESNCRSRCRATSSPSRSGRS